MTYAVKSPRKLIEVALPLDAINAASAREKSIRHGHPSTLHLWWARRPLATARAVLFAQLVNDPSWKWELENPGQIPPNHLKASWAAKRKQLFKIIEDLVQWENTTNEVVLERARAEIRRSWREICELNKDHPQATELFNPDKLPAFHDPFAGGGAIPLEAQRLGLESYASDLNPVAVLINKAMIEIPPKFAGRAPVGPLPPDKRGVRFDIPHEWPGATGLAEDVRRYGIWVREEAQKRIGHLYPLVEISPEMTLERPDLKPLVGQKLTVIAWLWARTVKSPSPAFSHVNVPLASSFVLSSKSGRETYVQPIVEGDRYRFTVQRAGGKNFSTAEFAKAAKGTKLGKAQDFSCLLSSSPISRASIRERGKAQELGQRLMAIVVEGPTGRVYLSPDAVHEEIAQSAESNPVVAEAKGSFLSGTTPTRAMITGGVCSAYGLVTWGHLFISRQLVALTTLSDLVMAVRQQVHHDALKSGMSDDPQGLDTGGTGATAYAEAVSVYLAFAVSRSADRGSSICTWDNSPKMEALRNTFGRQAIPMVWDFAEGNPFSDSSGNWLNNVEWGAKVLDKLPALVGGLSVQADAQGQEISHRKVISTDPPYYDNIGYADLSDFFYVWLRKTLRSFTICNNNGT
jgi:putative DNA methylase